MRSARIDGDDAPVQHLVVTLARVPTSGCMCARRRCRGQDRNVTVRGWPLVKRSGGSPRRDATAILELLAIRKSTTASSRHCSFAYRRSSRHLLMAASFSLCASPARTRARSSPQSSTASSTVVKRHHDPGQDYFVHRFSRAYPSRIVSLTWHCNASNESHNRKYRNPPVSYAFVSETGGSVGRCSREHLPGTPPRTTTIQLHQPPF